MVGSSRASSGLRAREEAPGLRILEPLAALSLVTDLDDWTKAEKRAMVDVIRAKAAPDEVEYLQALQHYDKLRDVLLQLGSTNKPANG